MPSLFRVAAMTILAVLIILAGVVTVTVLLHKTNNLTTTSISTTTGTNSNSSSSSSSTSTCLSSSQLATTSTNNSAVFNLETMPSDFQVGNYRFQMVYNGTGYGTSSNGSATTNLGYSLIFNITKGSEVQTIAFGSAPPAPYPPSVPSPPTATAFDGNVQMRWVATCNAIFFEVTA